MSRSMPPRTPLGRNQREEALRNGIGQGLTGGDLSVLFTAID
jgi:hypothetical protein